MVNVFPNIDTAVKHEGEAATTILPGVLGIQVVNIIIIIICKLNLSTY